MQNHELESWILSVADRVKKSQPIEDVRVEAKAEWPDDLPRAARQIAALANANSSESILWIVGLDDDNHKVTGADAKEFTDWIAGIRKQFDDSFAPEVRNLNVPLDGATLVGLYFETDRAPYVVKNPKFGQPGVKVELEVPWRDGTRTRSAKRSDLIRILSPRAKLPVIHVLHSTIEYRVRANPPDWFAITSLFVIPQDSPVTIARHLMNCTLHQKSASSETLSAFRLYGMQTPIEEGTNEKVSFAHLKTPSRIVLKHIAVEKVEPPSDTEVAMKLTIGTAETDQSTELNLRYGRPERQNKFWRILPECCDGFPF